METQGALTTFSESTDENISDRDKRLVEMMYERLGVIYEKTFSMTFSATNFREISLHWAEVLRDEFLRDEDLKRVTDVLDDLDNMRTGYKTYAPTASQFRDLMNKPKPKFYKYGCNHLRAPREVAQRHLNDCRRILGMQISTDSVDKGVGNAQ